MKLESKNKRSLVEPMFEAQPSKIVKFSLMAFASLGADNGVFRSFQLKFFTVLIFLFTFCIKTKSNNLNHEVIFEMNPNEKERIAKQQIYTVLRLNPDLMNNEAVLEAFFQEHEQGNIGKIDRIEQALEEDNLTLAGSETNSLVPENPIDANYKRFYEIYMAYTNGVYAETDNADLFAIASGCPQLDGAIVFQARALYESLNGNNFIIEGECLGGDREPHARLSQLGGAVVPTESLEKTQYFTDLLVYPNPTKDKFYITSKGINNASINLYDQQGRTIELKPIVIHDNLIELSNNLSSGIYVLSIENENEKTLKKVIVE